MSSAAVDDPGTPVPRVSVVLATYQRQNVLARAVRSVLDQTMADWELIVVDDEPSEETQAIVASFDDPRIRYVRHEQNKGLCAARNTGIRAARAPYLAFLDDDDVFLQRKLERQAELLDQSDERVGVVSCHERIIAADGTSTVRMVTLEGDVHRAILRDDLVRMQLLMVRRVCFDRVGLFDERLRMHDDFDMTLRLSRSFLFRTVPEPLVGIIGTPGGMSTNVEARICALETMIATHPELREQRRVRARWQRRLARHHAELGRRDQWRRYSLRAVRSDPLGPTGWVAWLAGELGGPSVVPSLGRLRGRVAQLRRARARR